jgi:hypothetical protein
MIDERTLSEQGGGRMMSRTAGRTAVLSIPDGEVRSAHRRALSAALAIALSCCLAISASTVSQASPSTRKGGSPTISLAPASLKAGSPALVVAQVPNGRMCQLVLSLGSRVHVASPKRKAVTKVLQFAWVVPKAVRPGHWQARLSCARTRHFSTRTIRTAGVRRGTAPLARRIQVVVVRPDRLPTGLGSGGGYPPHGEVLVHANEWFGGHGVNVYSNGCEGCWYKGKYPNTDGSEWYQCVELIERFVTEEHLGPPIHGNANELYLEAPLSAYERYPNGFINHLVSGDIIVLGGGEFGHVVIVDTVFGNVVNVVEQNASSAGKNTLQYNGSTLSPEWAGTKWAMPVIGVLHAKANTRPSGGTIGGEPPQSVTGNENVFMRDANGNLEQKWYTLGPNTWSGWLSLGAPAGTTLAGDPLVTNTGITGNENVFVTGANGSLYEIWYTPSAHAWSGWLSLGAPSGTTLVGEPFVLKSVTGNENVFMRAANGNLYEIWYTPSANAWSGWFSLGAPSGTTVAGDPYVNISSVTGNENVFVRAANGSLYQLWYTPSVHAWSGWQSFGAPSGTTVEGDPFVISSVVGNENVLVRAANGNLYQIWYTPSAHAWSGWLSFGAPSGTSLAGDPFVTITGITANEDVFMRGANGNLYEIWYTPSAHAWSGWLSLGAPSGTSLAGDPFALKGAPGNENVFARDANGSLQEVWYTPGAGWSGWLSLGSPGGTTLAGDPVVTR